MDDKEKEGCCSGNQGCAGGCGGCGSDNEGCGSGCGCSPAPEPEVIETAEISTDMLMSKIKQMSADYENFRNRSEREKTRMFDIGKTSVIEALLPIMDNFALATKNADTADSFVKGVMMIQNQLNHALEEIGVKKIEALGTIFDIKFHNAVSHVESETAQAGEIVEELAAGYIYKDTVIRHSMVVVAN